MADQGSIQKSLVEQIFDELFSVIEGREEFDSETIASIRQMVEKGNLKKAAQVVDGLKSAARKSQ